MKSVPKTVLLLAALALPIAAVLVSYAVTDGPRTPDVPDKVEVGSKPGPPPAAVSKSTGELPPPTPDDDDDDD
ncbi:hypothetical protein [Saccharopolyspora rosea]|uniref:hypothetical protein n=1 Tax=Saccharopolyspora rosea TaxID=524884 RepID=UPI0021DA235B|nr:hypothetical protein [Saccharopolyspora rosea]